MSMIGLGIVRLFSLLRQARSSGGAFLCRARPCRTRLCRARRGTAFAVTMAVALWVSPAAATAPVIPLDRLPPLPPELRLEEVTDDAPSHPLMEGFCSLLEANNYRSYTTTIVEQMRQSGQQVIGFGAPCEEIIDVERPEEEQNDFSQWIIYALQLDEAGLTVTDIEEEAGAYLKTLYTEFLGQTESEEEEASEANWASPDFSKPVLTDNALYWPLSLEISTGAHTKPVRGVATITLLDQTPYTIFWYANQVRSPLSPERMLAQQQALIRKLHRHHRENRTAAQKAAGGWLSTPVLFGIGLLIVLLVGVVFRRLRAARDAPPY